MKWDAPLSASPPKIAMLKSTARLMMLERPDTDAPATRPMINRYWYPWAKVSPATAAYGESNTKTGAKKARPVR